MNDKSVIQILDILRNEFPALRAVALHADTPLLSMGHLDSFAIITLLSALERAFKIDFDVDQIQMEQLETAQSLSELCIAAMHQQPAQQLV